MPIIDAGPIRSLLISNGRAWAWPWQGQGPTEVMTGVRSGWAGWPYDLYVVKVDASGIGRVWKSEEGGEFSQLPDSDLADRQFRGHQEHWDISMGITIFFALCRVARFGSACSV